MSRPVEPLTRSTDTQMPVAVQSRRFAARDESERGERWVTAAGRELESSGVQFPPRLFNDAGLASAAAS